MQCLSGYRNNSDMNKLKKHLAKTKKSQASFATEMVVRAATVNGWCNGTIPSIDYAIKIERVTGGAVRVTDWAEEAKVNS